VSRGRSARLVLEDGRIFTGRSFGAEVDAVAEVVFNTSHTGYQEVVTDPSYRSQAVVFTVPILGIYGITGAADDQSASPQAAAIICREASLHSSNWRATQTLPEYMKAHGIPGIEGVDTRTLVMHLREHGAKQGIITCSDAPDAELVQRAKAAPSMAGLDLAKVVTCKTEYPWTEGFVDENAPWSPGGRTPTQASSGTSIVVVDFGIKYDILRHLASRGLSIDVVPANTPAEAILERNPAGVMLSNGPGDPAAVGYGIETAKALVGREDFPVYGVCLGYQILALALGAKTHKMKFGHRGGNHPVRDLQTGKVLITSHNHGFAVDPQRLDGTPLVATYESLFDGTLEGVRHRELPVAAVQFHPEAGPGPHEAGEFFDAFVRATTTVAAPAGEKRS
jgi:carbamoyl-phosphate synthase small subunit